jgi:hypothetical protein
LPHWWRPNPNSRRASLARPRESNGLAPPIGEHSAAILAELGFELVGDRTLAAEKIVRLVKTYLRWIENIAIPRPIVAISASRQHLECPAFGNRCGFKEHAAG